jgi:hypothetical protein
VLLRSNFFENCAKLGNSCLNVRKMRNIIEHYANTA